MSVIIKVTGSDFFYTEDGIQKSIYVSIDITESERTSDVKADIEEFMSAVKEKYFLPQEVKS